MLSPAAAQFLYVPYYCEENVWHLAQAPELAGRQCDVVVISNARRSCAVWEQRAATRPTLPVLWDYHVVLLGHDPWEVWDLDTVLGLPHPARDYLRETFRAEAGPELAPSFRVVPSDVFVREFASDRSHMRDERGAFLSEPPPWPPIGRAGAASNLDRFIDMTRPFLGEVLALSRLAARIARSSAA